MDPINDIKPGIPVYTEDGEQLGAVKEVLDAVFKVDARMQPDYWLSRDDIRAFTVERVTLKFGKERLNDHKRPAPRQGG